MAQPAPRQVRLPRSGPGSKTVFLVALSTLVSVIAVGGMAVHVSYGQLRTSVNETLPVVLEWSRERLRERIERLPSEMDRLANTKGLRAWAASSRAKASIRANGDAVLKGAMVEALEPYPTFSGLIVLDRQGRMRGAVGTAPEIDALRGQLEKKNAVDSDLVDVMRSAEFRTDLAEVESTGLRVFSSEVIAPCLLISAPLLDLAGVPVASVHAVYRRRELSKLLRADLLGGGNLYLSDPAGRIAASAGDGGGGDSEMLAAALLQVGSEPEVVFLWDGHPAMVVTSAAPAEVFDWMLVARQTPVLATGRLLLAFLQIGAVAAVVVVLCTFLASIVARGMTRPLQALFEGMRRVSNGDLTVEISDQGVHGQFASLFRMFNAATKRQREKRDNADSNLRSLVEQNLAFQKQNDLLSTLSVTDGLTGLHNHRYFKEQLHREIKRQQRTREDLALLIIDIDDFKQLNDQFGHAAGDEFLKQLARILEETVRDTDVLARYGGEEFVVLATGTDTLGAVTMAEKLRTQVAETSFIVDSSMRPRRVTVSVGVSLYKHSQSEMFTAADAALYRAKSAGKNCVVADEEPVDEA
jgi:diguanylate cyclase (GGDEF)-like protein